MILPLLVGKWIVGLIVRLIVLLVNATEAWHVLGILTTLVVHIRLLILAIGIVPREVWRAFQLEVVRSTVPQSLADRAIFDIVGLLLVGLLKYVD